jgi:hypothetical protein
VKNFTIYIFILLSTLFLSACIPSSTPKKEQTQVTQKVVPAIVVEEVNTTKIEDEVVELTPLQKCKKEQGKFSLIVNAPENSRIRILNIKPKYEECIQLKKGRYLIEVTKKSYKKHKEWIKVDKDTELDVKLFKIKHKKPTVKPLEDDLEKAAYNLEELNEFIKKYPKNQKYVKIAQDRIKLIENEFKSYSPHSLIGAKNCKGFYPKRLVEDMLNISADIKYWDKIRWSGSCKNGLMYSRGVIYFESKDGLHVELKGKMRNGFFFGNVYNYSRFKDKPEFIKDSGRHNYKIRLHSKNDYEEYQE